MFRTPRQRPGLLLIGVDASGDELLVLSSHSSQALSVADLVNIIRQKESDSEQMERGTE